MTTLREILRERRSEIVNRWIAGLERAAAPSPVPPTELVDHFPQVLDDIVADLNDPEACAVRGETSASAKHGIHRFRVGFDLDSVIREYRVLFVAILDECKVEGAWFAADELKVLSSAIITSIGEAVTQYAAQRDAEQRRQTSEHFGFIAHELRNPLAAARMAFDSLYRSSLLPEHRLVDILAGGLTRMGDLIDNFLSLALLGTGAEPNRHELRIAAMARDAADENLGQAKHRGVSIALADEQETRLEADPRLLHSILTNLVGNAVKFSRRGGRVDISWRATERDVSIEVADECGGLPRGKIETIFAPFAQLKSERGGHGLGLAIARQAAEAHGGSIRVRDVPGHGCVFTVEIPRSRPSAKRK